MVGGCLFLRSYQVGGPCVRAGGQHRPARGLLPDDPSTRAKHRGEHRQVRRVAPGARQLTSWAGAAGSATAIRAGAAGDSAHKGVSDPQALRARPVNPG